MGSTHLFHLNISRNIKASICRMSTCGIFLLCALGTYAAPSVSHKDVETALEKVDHELSLREGYVANRKRFIERLKRDMDSIPSGAASLKKILAVGEAYEGFNTDSAVKYFTILHEEGHRQGLDSLAAVGALRAAAILPLNGTMGPALSLFASVDTTGFSREQMILYHNSGRSMYGFLSDLRGQHKYADMHFADKATEHQRQLIHYLSKDSPMYLMQSGGYYFTQGELAKAWSYTSQLMRIIPRDSRLFAYAAYQMSTIARAEGNYNEEIYYLALSATADLKAAVQEISSLQTLGQRLYDQGDVERAYDYLIAALKSAVNSGSELRISETGFALPFIEASHAAQLDRSRQRMLWVLGGLAILLIVVVSMFVKLRKEMTRMERLRNNLTAANAAKQVYISQFLELCSIYMDKLNQFCKFANRKISAGKVDDLYKMTKSGKFIEEQSKEFYEVFDNAFLHLYPDFPEKVNSLLNPDEQLEIPTDGTLTTDLRLLAFMRLGIEESGRIAELLNYSVNTIYSYRNRLRNRAVNRDTFEADIMAIRPSDEQWLDGFRSK